MKTLSNRNENIHPRLNVFLLSFVALYFELVMIRWISSEIRVFAYLKNLPLIASFLGLGLGCACANYRKNLLRYLPFLLASLCLIVAFSRHLGITFLPFPIGDYIIVGDVSGGFDYSTLNNKLWALGKLLLVVTIVFGLCAACFVSLGQKLGRLLQQLAPLHAYSINIAGSLAGVLVFSAISFAGWGPLLWFALGFTLLIPFLERRLLGSAIFAMVLLAIVLVPYHALWSPYYRIDLSPIYEHQDSPHSALVGYNLNVNHDYHQRMLDLSVVSPENEFTRKARPYYSLPYRFVKPERVLVVGAGSGNDVAAALRNGATHVDAVEIDPLIIDLGRRLHPERPYSSNNVRVINNDARAFFKQSGEKYDLIVFGLLDSQTLLSSMSSIRLDNYIYTQESLSEARRHLRVGGSVSLSFALTEAWIQERFYRMLEAAFQQEPLCLQTPYDAGISYLLGPTAKLGFVRGQPDLEAMVINDKIPRMGTSLPTDDWPFLYLRDRTIPFAYWFTLSVLFLLSLLAIRQFLGAEGRTFLIPLLRSSNVFMFLLGAGFMLVEVKSISDLSLLYGSTWLVNSAVIAAILVMILLANLLVLRFSPRSMNWVYVGLSASLVFSYFFKPDTLAGLSFQSKAVLGGMVSALPIFFAGILFATSFKRVPNVPEAFGANLLGALVGGILENACMVYGIAFLNWLALAIYLGSALVHCKLRPKSLAA